MKSRVCAKWIQHYWQVMTGTKILFKGVRVIPMSMLIVNYGHYAGTSDNILVLFKLSGFFAFRSLSILLKSW